MIKIENRNRIDEDKEQEQREGRRLETQLQHLIAFCSFVFRVVGFMIDVFLREKQSSECTHL